MKSLAFALITCCCALIHAPVWAQGGQGSEGSAQRLPFSQVPLGERADRALGSSTNAIARAADQTGGGSTCQASQSPTGESSKSPFEELAPPTLEDEVGRIVQGMLDALRALDRIAHRPDGERILRDTMKRSLEDLQPGSNAIKEYLGPDQNALTEAELADATRTFRQMLEGALEADDPRAFLASRRAILEQPDFADRAAAYYRQRREDGEAGMVTARIGRAAGGVNSAADPGEYGGSQIQALPDLPGFPGYKIDPSMGLVFRQYAGSWIAVPDPR